MRGVKELNTCCSDLSYKRRVLDICKLPRLVDISELKYHCSLKGYSNFPAGCKLKRTIFYTVSLTYGYSCQELQAMKKLMRLTVLISFFSCIPCHQLEPVYRLNQD